MASYCGTIVEHRGSEADASGFAHFPDEDDIAGEPPPASVGQDERRMQVRAYNHWTSLLGSRNFPRIEDLGAAELPDFAENAVVLDFSDGIENPAITMLGARLAEECGAALTIGHLRDVPGESLLSRITDRYRQVLVNQAPIGFEAEFINQRGKTVVYRGMLLPFSSDDATIGHILGVINWKEVVDPVKTAGLIGELDRASLPAILLEPILGEWADGPAAAEHAGMAAAPFGDREGIACALARRPALRPTVQEKLTRKLRALPMLNWHDIAAVGDEFALVLVRRLPAGGLRPLGELRGDGKLIARAAKRFLR